MTSSSPVIQSSKVPIPPAKAPVTQHAAVLPKASAPSALGAPVVVVSSSPTVTTQATSKLLPSTLTVTTQTTSNLVSSAQTVSTQATSSAVASVTQSLTVLTTPTLAQPAVASATTPLLSLLPDGRCAYLVSSGQPGNEKYFAVITPPDTQNLLSPNTLNQMCQTQMVLLPTVNTISNTTAINVPNTIMMSPTATTSTSNATVTSPPPLAVITLPPPPRGMASSAPSTVVKSPPPPPSVVTSQSLTQGVTSPQPSVVTSRTPSQCVTSPPPSRSVTSPLPLPVTKAFDTGTSQSQNELKDSHPVLRDLILSGSDKGSASQTSQTNSKQQTASGTLKYLSLLSSEVCNSVNRSCDERESER